MVAQDHRVFPEGQPILQDQGHAAMLTCLRHVEETVVPVTRPCVGGSLSSLTTDASLTGWGVVMSGRSAQGLWEGPHLMWHINCLEILAVFQALKHFLPDLRDQQVLVRTDNTSVVSYVNHQRGLRSHPLYRLARQILLWTQGKLLSLKAVYIPGQRWKVTNYIYSRYCN